MRAWAAAGETERVRETADLALALVSDVDDSVTRVALLSNIAIALGAARFDEQSIDLLVEARAELACVTRTGSGDGRKDPPKHRRDRNPAGARRGRQGSDVLPHLLPGPKSRGQAAKDARLRNRGCQPDRGLPGAAEGAPG